PCVVNYDATLSMAARRGALGKCHVAADNAVMRDMCVGEEIALVSDDRGAPARIRAHMHGHAFADGAVAADRKRGAAALVAGILRRAAEDGQRINFRASTDRR